jgi:hypothetical protein
VDDVERASSKQDGGEEYSSQAQHVAPIFARTPGVLIRTSRPGIRPHRRFFSPKCAQHLTAMLIEVNGDPDSAIPLADAPGSPRGFHRRPSEMPRASPGSNIVAEAPMRVGSRRIVRCSRDPRTPSQAETSVAVMVVSQPRQIAIDTFNTRNCDGRRSTGATCPRQETGEGVPFSLSLPRW